jgi:hypothetical protein
MGTVALHICASNMGCGSLPLLPRVFGCDVCIPGDELAAVSVREMSDKFEKALPPLTFTTYDPYAVCIKPKFSHD